MIFVFSCPCCYTGCHRYVPIERDGSKGGSDNGCALVLASIAATQMAISLRLKTLLGSAIVCYVGAWLAIKVDVSVF